MKTNDSKTFLTTDGIELEVLCSFPEDPKACMVVWPCMGGAVQMYRVPVEEFTALGCACILYNPRGHGRSAGGMEIQAALDDLEEILEAGINSSTPLIMIGHSAGANACLQYGARRRLPERFVLVAPVLDSRESLFSMYERRTIAEFTDILCAYAEDDACIRRVLEDEQWLTAEVWNANGYRHMLDSVPSRIRLGEFLENLFIPGHNAFAELAGFADRTCIYMAAEDTWYPAATTEGLARKHSIRIETIEEAKNHFFFGAWERVWSEVLGLVSLIVAQE